MAGLHVIAGSIQEPGSLRELLRKWREERRQLIRRTSDRKRPPSDREPLVVRSLPIGPAQGTCLRSGGLLQLLHDFADGVFRVAKEHRGLRVEEIGRASCRERGEDLAVSAA